jgi:signal transduction histidine kinase
MVPSQPEAVSNTLDEELLCLLARQGRRMPFPVFLAAAMLTWLASDPPGLPGRGASLWLAAVAAVLVLRMVVLGRLPAMTIAPHQRLRIAVALSALNGVIHGAAMLLFAAPNEFQFAIQSLLLVGLCAGAVATTAGYRPAFLAFVLPVMGALVLRWSVSSASGSAAVAILIAIFAVVLASLAADSFRLFRESFEIRLQHVKLNGQLRAALAQAETANRAKTRFLASASHDLRQPIHTLSLFAAALAMRPLDAVSRDISQHIDTALGNLSGQLDALLDISKLDAGVVTAQPVIIELAPFVQRMLTDFAPIAAAKGLALSGQAAAVAICTDEVLLGRIVANLLDNAIKYTEHGTVSLAVERHGDQALLIIRDSGRGIAPHEHERVFDEFYQLDNPERNRSKGLGLGLSIVRRLVDLLGAHMDMASMPGTGTSFYLSFPSYDGALVRAPVPADAGDTLAHRHVLVVDDEHAVRLGMQALLQGLGARVTLADGSFTAMAAARAEAPDLLLVDFRLRGEDDGIALVHALRVVCPGLPAILISGDTAPERLREARQAGIPMLHKPVPAAVLRNAVADLAIPTIATR